MPAFVPRGTTYQSTDADWTVDTRAPGRGFACLKFSVDQPQRYSYAYEAVNPTATNGTFSAFAYGDLDGDGNTSTFELRGAIQSGTFTMAPAIIETNPEE